MNALPPRPTYRGASWPEEWRERLERTPIWLFEWLRQQHDGPYWRQGSLAPDYDAIDDADVPDRRLDGRVRRCRAADARALHGAARGRSSATGSTTYPDDAYPGPNVDWHHEMVRFFDHWLKGVDNGVMDEPALVAVPPRLGRARALPRRLAGRLDRRRRAGRRPDLGEPGAPPRAGAAAAGRAPERRRRPADAGGRAVPPSADDRDARRPVVGRRRPAERRRPRPAARTTRSARSSPRRRSSRPRRRRGPASVAPPGSRRSPSRPRSSGSSDVAPGRDAGPGQRRDPEPDPPRVARGARAARARAWSPRSASRSAPTAHRFAAGHRIRLSVASSMWPVVWPSPFPAEYGLHLGGAPARVTPRPAGPARPATPATPSRRSRPTPAGLRGVSARTAATRRPGRSSRT